MIRSYSVPDGMGRSSSNSKLALRSNPMVPGNSQKSSKTEEPNWTQEDEEDERQKMQSLIAMEQRARGIVARRKVAEDKERLKDLIGKYEKRSIREAHDQMMKPVHFKSKSRYQWYHEMTKLTDPMSQAMKADTINRYELESQANKSIRSVLRIHDVKSVEEQVKHAGGDEDAGLTTMGTSSALLDALSKFDMLGAQARDKNEEREEMKRQRMARLANLCLYGNRRKSVDTGPAVVQQERQWTEDEIESMKRPIEVGISKFDAWLEKQSTSIKKSQKKQQREWSDKRLVQTAGLLRDWDDFDNKFVKREVFTRPL